MDNKIQLGDSGDSDAGEYAVTDSEDNYSEGEKEILEEIRKGRKKKDEGKQEILGFADSDEEDDDDDDDDDDEEEGGAAGGGADDDEYDVDMKDMMGDSDIEGAEDDEGLPDAMDWGKNKKNYYNTDFVDPDYDGYNEEQEELAFAEEEEAKAIQQRLLKQMKEDDFNIAEMFPTIKAPDSDEEGETQPLSKKSKVQKSQADLANLSKREQEQLFHKDSPEFRGLVGDFKKYFTEVIKVLRPVLDHVERKKFPMIPAFEFAQFYQHLIFNYCLNITFYLHLKAKKIPIKYHPVTKHLVKFKKFITDLEEKYETVVKVQLTKFLKQIEENDDIEVLNPLELRQRVALAREKSKKLAAKQLKKDKKKTKKANDTDEDDEDDKDDNEYIDHFADHDLDEEAAMKEALFGKKDDKIGDYVGTDEEEEDNDDEEQNKNYEENDDDEEGEEEGEGDEEESRRGINYQISKNKGLTPHRKKELRNPRVKHRNKYRKALVRRKGAVRTVRKEIKRYDGELCGIKANVSKSIKIKV